MSRDLFGIFMGLVQGYGVGKNDPDIDIALIQLGEELGSDDPESQLRIPPRTMSEASRRTIRGLSEKKGDELTYNLLHALQRT